MRRKNLGWIIMVLVIGALVGSALGEVLALILPPGVVREFFLRSAIFSFGPGDLDLSILKFTFGFSLKLNVIGALGVLLVGYILRWTQ